MVGIVFHIFLVLNILLPKALSYIVLNVLQVTLHINPQCMAKFLAGVAWAVGAFLRVNSDKLYQIKKRTVSQHQAQILGIKTSATTRTSGHKAITLIGVVLAISHVLNYTILLNPPPMHGQGPDIRLDLALNSNSAKFRAKNASLVRKRSAEDCVTHYYSRSGNLLGGTD